MEKTAVLTDSGTGLTQKEAQEAGLFFLPLQVLHEDRQYLDGVSIQLHEVYDLLKQQAKLTTSMPPIGLVEETLTKIKEAGYDSIICIPITSGLSSSMALIQATAEEIGIKVHLIDCYSTCYLQRYLAMCAKQLADQGIAAEEIVKRLNDSIASSNTLIIPDDLQHLKRGGRLTPVAAALGGLLKIKPLLQLNQSCEGKIDVYDKVRTMSKAQEKAINTFVNEHVDGDYICSCLHTDALEAGNALKDKLQAALPNTEIYFGYIGAVISVHTGIGCLGIQYMKKVAGC
ncbi:MAG: DegV family protein [Erysipelotrichaceae bacterium]|nr:DegV family protein [Erysipelotrichaceae bacterium]